MSATDGGKIRTRRRHIDNKPYSRNLSLFGKIKKSVTDLFVPSWLLSSPQQNEWAATGDAGHRTQASAMSIESNCFSSGSDHNLAATGNARTDQTSMLVDDKELQLTWHNRGTNIYHVEPNVSEQLDKLPTVDSEDSKKQWPSSSSVSQTSAPGGHMEKADPLRSRLSGVEKADPLRSRLSGVHLNDLEEQRSGSARAQQHIMTSTLVHNQSLDLDISENASKKPRIWTPEANKRINIFSPVKGTPAFNAVLLGSPSDSSVLANSFNDSIFYTGKTRFGGASAERQAYRNTSLPYQTTLPLRKQVRAHNISKDIEATTSSTARRILETLDKMSTPLGDAKKMPVSSTATNDSVLSFVPSSYRQGSLVTGRPVSRPLQLPSRGPPTSQHQILAQAVIARNRYQSGVVDLRQKSFIIDEEDISTSESTEESARLSSGVKPPASSLDQAQQSASLGKMKAKRFSQHVSSAGSNNDQVNDVPNLRTDFTLPVSSMMPITLHSYTVKSHTTKESSIPASDVPVPLKFVFSAPIDVDTRKQAQCQIADSTDKSFQFTSPMKTSHIKTSAVGAEGGSKTCQEPAIGASSGTPVWAAFTASVPAWGSTAPKPKVSSPDIGGTSSSFKSYNKWGGFEKIDDSSAASDTSTGGFSLAPAASLKSGSVMDILGGGQTSTPAIDDLMAKFKKPAGSWECEACMIVNKPEATKCVCCDTARSGLKPTSSSFATSKPSNKSSTSVTIADSLKAQSGTSKCDTSTGLNKFDAGKILLTDTSKSVSKQPLNCTGSVNSLSAMFKKPVGSWECETCMVQNTPMAVRCIACDSSKPGSQSAGIVTKTPAPSSTIIISPTGGFTLNTSAMTTTTTSGSGGFRFDTINSSSTSTPSVTGFTFGQTNTSNKDSSTCISTPLTGGFKFGASPGSDTGGTASGTCVFGAGFTGSGFANNSSIKTSDSGQAVLPKSEFSDITRMTDSRNGSNDLTDFNKSNSTTTAVFQFGTMTNSTSVASTESSLNNTKLPQKEVATSSLLMPSSQTLPNNLFQFGSVSSIVPVASSGLGMGKSLSDMKPMINGGFGSNFEVKAGSKPDANKPFESFTFGNTAPNVFGGFGQSSGSSTESSIVQSTQQNKRSVDFSDSDQPSVKKPFSFEAAEPSSNGLFAFSGSSETKASPFVVNAPSTGGFQFNSNTPAATQTGGPAPGGGFQLSFGSTAPDVQGFNFSFKTQNERPNPFETGTNTGPVQLSATPNFNFSGSAVTQQAAVFQFGAKTVDSSAPAQGLFTFGASHQPVANSDGGSSVGSFNIGTGDSVRKMKKGVRRIKK